MTASEIDEQPVGVRFERAVDVAARLLANVETVVHGKREEIRLVLAALACGRPRALRGRARHGEDRARARDRAVVEGAVGTRIQCTPDLQPTDVTGLSVYNQQTRDFEFRPGPIFANVVLVDEINRAMPKTQSALLEAMAERQVTVDGVTRELPDAVPADRDREPDRARGHVPAPRGAARPLLPARPALGYPGDEQELRIMREQRRRAPARRPRSRRSRPRSSPSSSTAVEDVYVDELLERWIVELVRATRELRGVEIGASVRGTLALERAARAWALLHGRDYVTPGGRRAALPAGARPPADVHADVPRRDAQAERRRGARRSSASAASSSRRRPSPTGTRTIAASSRVAASVPPRRHLPARPAPAADRARRSARMPQPRRGRGSDVAGSRPYGPGDRSRHDRLARVGAASRRRAGGDEFVVREKFAEEAPRVVVLVRPPARDGALPAELPVARRSRAAFARPRTRSSTARVAARGAVGYLDYAGERARGAPVLAAAARPARALARRRAARAAPGSTRREDTSSARSTSSAAAARDLPSGSFVFVVSDFLAPPPPETWLHARRRRWDVVPV